MLRICAKTCLATMILAITSACSTSAYKLYEGDPLSLDQVSLIKYEGDPWYAPGGVRVWTLDGCLRSRKGLSPLYFGSGWNGSYYIELLPGQHTLTASYSHGTHRSNEDAKAALQSEAGRVYVVIPFVQYGPLRWTPVLKDVGNIQDDKYARLRPRIVFENVVPRKKE